MVEQVKSIDYQARKAKFIGTASEDFLDTVLSILVACIYGGLNKAPRLTRKDDRGA